jgi:hypothetical protein
MSQQIPPPWALSMALDCLDPQTGQVAHWPRQGGWHEQDSTEMALMTVAWRTWKWFKDEKSQLWSDNLNFRIFLSSALQN